MSAERFVRVCPLHGREARETSKGDLLCPAGPGRGHHVETWRVVDRARARVIGEANKDSGGDFLPPGKEIRVTEKKTTPNTKDQGPKTGPKTLATTKLVDEHGNTLFLRLLRRVTEPPFAVRWQHVPHGKKNGTQGFAASATSAETGHTALNAQVAQAQKDGWKPAPPPAMRRFSISKFPSAMSRGDARRRA